MRSVLACCVVLALLPSTALADHPPRPFATFDAAKRVARDAIYSDHRINFYCGCAFTPTKTKSGGTIDPCEDEAVQFESSLTVAEWDSQYEDVLIQAAQKIAWA